MSAIRTNRERLVSQAVLGQVFGGGVAGQGVVVGDEVEALVLGLQLEVLAHGAEVVADVQPSGGLDTR